MNYYDEVVKLIRHRKITKVITRETKFKELGVDSLDLMDMVVDLEKHFGVEFTDEQLVNLNTIGDLVVTLEILKKK